MKFVGPPPRNVQVTFSGGFFSWMKEKAARIRGRWDYRWKYRNKPKPEKKKDLSKTEKSRRRRIKGLATVFARLTKPPKWFLTLQFDRKVKRKWKVRECREYFTKFRRYLERKYPECWFVFVMEFSDQSGPHYHLIGRFGGNFSSRAIRKKWLQITGSTRRKAVHLTRYRRKHPWYVSSAKKAPGTLWLMYRLGRKSFWGCIHRKKMPLAPFEQITLTLLQFQWFREAMDELLRENSAAKSSIRRLWTDANCLCYATNEMVRAALRYALELDGEE